MLPRTSLLLALFVVACDTPKGTDTGDTDTGAADTDTDLPDASVPDLSWYEAGTPTVAAPALSWLETGLEVAPPVLTCRDGWTPTELDNGATICEPWPSGSRETCESDTAMHLPGTDGCVEVGAACPAGDWPEALPGSGVWYVSPGGEGDGTSADSPLGSVAAAMAAAGAGDTIALAKGTYDEALTVTGDVTLVGACAAETTLTATAIDESGAVLTLDGGALTLRDLQVSDAPGMGLVGSGGSLAIDGVAFVGNTAYNVYTEETTITVNDTLVADAQAQPSDGLYGYGLTTIGGTLTLTNSAVVHNTGAGVKLKDGTATLDSVLIAETEPRGSDLTIGRGIEIQGTHVGTLAGLVVEDVYDIAVRTSGTSRVSLTDSVVRHVKPRASDAQSGVGVIALDYAETTVASVYVTDFGQAGFMSYTYDDADDYAVSLTITDAVVTGGVRPPGSPGGGWGMLGNALGTLTATRVVSTDNEGDAFALMGEVSATLTDIRGERSGPTGSGNAGVYVEGADVTVERARLVDNEGYGIFAQGASTVTATDVYVAAPGVAPGSVAPAGVFGVGIDALSLGRALVEDVAYIGLLTQDCGAVTVSDTVLRQIVPDGDGTYGVGVVLAASGTATVDRVEVSDTRLAGFNVVGSATLNDLRVSRTTSSEGFGALGTGVFLESAEVTGARWVIEESQNAGIALNASDLTLSDVLVDGVTQRSCVTTTCPDDSAASGVYLDRTSTLALSAFLVQGAEGVGVQTKGAATLADGYVRDGAYGTEAVANGTIAAERVDVSGAGAAAPDSEQPTPTLVY